MDMIFVNCIFQNRFYLISVTHAVGTHWNCLIGAILMCTYNMSFH